MVEWMMKLSLSLAYNTIIYPCPLHGLMADGVPFPDPWLGFWPMGYQCRWPKERLQMDLGLGLPTRSPLLHQETMLWVAAVPPAWYPGGHKKRGREPGPQPVVKPRWPTVWSWIWPWDQWIGGYCFSIPLRLGSFVTYYYYDNTLLIWFFFFET